MIVPFKEISEIKHASEYNKDLKVNEQKRRLAPDPVAPGQSLRPPELLFFILLKPINTY